MARPTKLTAEMIRVICTGIRNGLTYKESAQMAGVHEATFYRWKKKAEKAKTGLFCEFCESLKKANVEAKALHLNIINKTAQGGLDQSEDRRTTKRTTCSSCAEVATEETITEVRKKTLPVWQASAWILERRFPDEFGRNVQPKENEEDDPFQKWVDALNDAEAKYGHLPAEALEEN